MTIAEPTDPSAAAADAAAADAAPPIEVELKYRLRSLADGERWRRAARIGAFRPVAGSETEVDLVDHYVETPERGLRAAGYGARIRVDRNSTTVTVKSTGTRPGPGWPVRREELEGPADLDLPPAAWAPSAARDRLIELAAGRPILPLVTLRQRRRHRSFEASDGTLADLSVDEVEVLVPGGAVLKRFAELEVELVAGDEATLAGMASVLEADPALDGDRASKLATAVDAIEAARP